ncbi:decarboxylating NADP(+)-dependent phosphogluconate dehydrogenase [Buchnera aphidicola]|uniref:decarboxylating NADP(+)-dependent phosphogluconate dehydrogenase n=1 Tax=Buchnera aphidicola TaxID=9 RepID=UPI003464097F
MKKNDIGVLGMAVMGRNLALNIANHGYNVSLFNRTSKRTKDVFLENQEKTIFPYFSIQDFVYSLNSPKCILLMVQAGSATDEIISNLIPFLKKGDIIIDGGNSFYKDTVRRYHDLLNYNINFIGSGISGGEYGALTGPSIMPGGKKEAYDIISPILKSISAHVESEPCVSYIGPDGAGHYVKMVHNGIEYADMQLISETYAILKNLLFLNNQQISDVFCNWNKGELSSYLIEITKNIFLKKDNDGNDLIDIIVDEASNKGTGKWTCLDALELNEPLTLITSSVFSRYLSSLRSQRVLASKILKGPKVNSISMNKDFFIEQIRKSLYLGKIISYAQGFSQLHCASNKYDWNLKYHNIAKIFRGGCIIQASFLKKIVKMYESDNAIINLLFSSYFQEIANNYHTALREVVSYAIQQGLSVPAFSAAISYYDGYRTSFSSANLIQAQRDYFGAHTYKRYDKNGSFHTNWL